MAITDAPFLPGTGEVPIQPLGRYIPPIPAGMVSSWLTANVPPGSWILDPIGSNPAIALEIVEAGYNLLVSSNNPLLSFILEELTTKPDREAFVKVISYLANSRREDQSLEDYIQSFYLTTCPECGKSTPARSYTWQRGEPQPESVRFQCLDCGALGEKAFTTEDLARFKTLPSDSLNRSRARSRVFKSLTRNEAPVVEEVLEAYLPRPLHILTTLINRAEGLTGLTQTQKQLLTALLISLCDDAVGYWPVSSLNHRPKQVLLPAQFVEKNLWYSLEGNIDEWVNASAQIELTHWPNLPESNAGICLFSSRLKELLPLPAILDIKAIISAVPRPNQAFWVLSAIWTGWLWGHSAVDPIRVALDRQRYDWFWLAQALRSNLSRLQSHIAPSTPFFSIGTELTPGIATAHFAAPAASGFSLKTFAYESEREMLQLMWTLEPPKEHSVQLSRRIIHSGLQETLSLINEPVDYLDIYVATLHHLSVSGILPSSSDALTANLLTEIQEPLRDVLMRSNEFEQFAAKGSTEEAGKWYLRPLSPEQLALSDRVEQFLVEQIVKSKHASVAGLLSKAYVAFPGMLTPPISLLKEVIASYSNPDGTEPGWVDLRFEDYPAARREDLRLFNQLIHQIGERMGYTTDTQKPNIWFAGTGDEFYLFEPIVTAMLSKALNRLEVNPAIPPTRKIIALPGGRSNLAEFKISRNPALKAAFTTGIRLLKFRALREIADAQDVTLESFFSHLDGDPPKWEGPAQFTLFRN